MKLSLAPFRPFDRCAWIKVPMTPLGYVLMAGKFYDCAPLVAPEIDTEIVVFVDLPGENSQDGLEWLAVNHDWLQRMAAEWLISPVCLDVRLPWDMQVFDPGGEA